MPVLFLKAKVDCAVPHEDDESCEECCEHMDMDGGQCLDCGADRTEDMMARAYDCAKASWQD